MAVVRDLVAVKGSHVMSIGRQATVLDAAVLMNDFKIGALVVIECARVVGIITERDILSRVVAARRDPVEVLVDEVMTRDIVVCGPDSEVEEASLLMKERRVRHLPVIDADGGMVGLISIGDVNAFHTESQEKTIYHLHEYIYGRV
ncbi:MAG: CBS domain-containing protein [Planctomycetota bacterium]